MNRWHRNHIEQQETVITLLADGPVTAADAAVSQFRRCLQDYIETCPAFGTSHKPVQIPPEADARIRQMGDASARVNVGPMASVAGQVSAVVLETLLENGVSEAVVDNGGDIALFVNKAVHVGIYAGESPIDRLAFRIEPTVRPLGICTSSGTVGHSFSYGRADAAIVISENIPLADAAATALCNRIQTRDDLEACFDFMNTIPEIQGAMVILGVKAALWGTLPELVEADVDTTLITQGKYCHTEKTHAENLR